MRLGKFLTGDTAQIFLKLEFSNIGGSHKARIALGMVLDAIQRGELVEGKTLLEGTGGNTGLGLAMAGKALGFPVVLVIPDNYSKAKQRLLRAYGADVQLTDSSMPGSHSERAMEIFFDAPDRYVVLNQSANPANPLTHRLTTGPELLLSLRGIRIDYFIGGVGTGGSLTGIGEILKLAYPALRIVAVQPEGCDLRTGVVIPHGIQGFSVGATPANLNLGLIDEFESVTEDEARSGMTDLLDSEGVCVGVSSGANVAVARRIARRSADANIVTLAYDSGVDYLDLP